MNQAFALNLDNWLKRRLPKAQEVTLSQRRIFIVPTKLALGMTLLAVLLFILAINFQNSLVYAICFWLLALLVLNILHTYRNLAGLTLKTIALQPCFAGENAVLELELSCSPKQKKYAINIGWPEHDMTEIHLVEQTSTRIQLSHPTTKRGYFVAPRLSIETRYPTRLAVAWSYLRPDCSGIVYPTPKEQAFKHTLPANSLENTSGHDIPQGSTDFGGIRTYQPGDTPRQIHWAKYAQTGSLHTKVFVDHASHELWLDWDELPFPGIEARLSHLCSRILSCDAEQQDYGLNIPGTKITPGHGAAHKQRCLTALALFGEQP